MAMNHEPVAAPMDASLESIVDNQKVYPACPVPFEKVEVDHQTWPKYGYSKVIKLFGTKRVAWCAGEDLGAWHSFRHWLEIVDENGNFIVRGDTTIYESLARLEDEGQLFIAGTEFWAGGMPTEQPMLVQTGVHFQNPRVLDPKRWAPTAKNAMWYCRDCDFQTLDLSAAALHTDEVDTMEHWLFEHPDCDKTKPAMRAIHGSDQGWPPYVNEWPFKVGG